VQARRPIAEQPCFVGCSYCIQAKSVVFILRVAWHGAVGYGPLRLGNTRQGYGWGRHTRRLHRDPDYAKVRGARSDPGGLDTSRGRASSQTGMACYEGCGRSVCTACLIAMDIETNTAIQTVGDDSAGALAAKAPEAWEYGSPGLRGRRVAGARHGHTAAAGQTRLAAVPIKAASAPAPRRAG
jgi:hypothetical protein